MYISGITMKEQMIQSVRSYQSCSSQWTTQMFSYCMQICYKFDLLKRQVLLRQFIKIPIMRSLHYNGIVMVCYERLVYYESNNF